MEETNRELAENLNEVQPPDIFTSDKPTPDNPPWNGWSAFGVWALSVILIIVFPLIFVMPYLLTKSVNLTDSLKTTEFLQSDSTAVFLQLLSVIPAHLLTLVLAWFVVTKYNTFSFQETLGWQWNGFKVWHTFVLFIFFYAIALVLTMIFGEVENEFEKMLNNSRTAVYLVAFFATFTAPLVEEVTYRGLLYSAFQRKFGIPLAVFLVTLLFTAVHIPQYSSSNVPDFAPILTLLIVSLTLTLIRVRTGNLLPCIVMHTVFNGIQSILLIIQPFLPENIVTTPEHSAAFISFLSAILNL